MISILRCNKSLGIDKVLFNNKNNMKSIIVFDDDIFNSFKNMSNPKIIERKEDSWIRWDMMYWMKVYNWIQTKKVFARYMWNKNKRIQKKWDKIYNDRFIEKKFNPMLNMNAIA